ncbi:MULTISPECIES: Pycsar system effector family protein [Catenuloplanes]|uniref:Nucleic acid-binding protein n=1 Tax=Catenuloplanes niger TaxID=587534 RepID=A0AAE3ZQY2_9ACTN|nr:Pycsar system effector family protein [Catenuloplanes niger]MDR7323349.1 putative nucleic acid-binding protein [Catenuloplanes niger]
MSAPEPVQMSPVQQGEAQIARADGKAQAIGAIAGTMLSISAAGLSITALPSPVRAGGWTLVAVWLVSVGLLLLALRPDLAGDHGIVRWARLSLNELRAELNTADPIRDTEARTVAWLSRAAVRKHRRIRLAIDLLIASPATALAAALIAWLL